MLERVCEQCGEKFQAQRRTARYCSQVCRNGAHRVRHGKALAPVRVLRPAEPVKAAQEPRSKRLEPTGPGPIEVAVRAELEQAGRLESVLGQTAIRLAQRIDGPSLDTGSSVAALTRELRATLGEALRNAVIGDELDELEARRQAKLGGA